MVNIWNPYQCVITFNLARSASYVESGVSRGIGFRDSDQDLLGFMRIGPIRARERILDLAAAQMEDGGAYHQYQPLTKRGNSEIGSGFNDDPLWLVLSVAESVFIAGLFVLAAKEMASIAPWQGRAREARQYSAAAAKMEATALRDGWGRARFLRAYGDSGGCVMAGIGLEFRRHHPVDSGHPSHVRGAPDRPGNSLPQARLPGAAGVPGRDLPHHCAAERSGKHGDA